MASPKMTKADSDGTPRCPHCSAELWSATVTIESLITHYPFGGWISIGDDGFARDDEHLTTNCGECHKPVAVGFNSDPEHWHQWMVKFVAARTRTDLKMLEF